MDFENVAKNSLKGDDYLHKPKPLVPIIEDSNKLSEHTDEMKMGLKKNNNNDNPNYDIGELQFINGHPSTSSSYIIRFKLPRYIANELKEEECKDLGHEVDSNATCQRIENGVKLLESEYHIFDDECTLKEKPTKEEYFFYIKGIIKNFFVFEKMPDEKKNTIESYIDKYLRKVQVLLNQDRILHISEFTRIFVISFLCLIGNIISTFTELSYGFYFDENEYLNLEIYAANINVFFSLAEKYSYPLQLKITSQKEVVINGLKQPPLLYDNILRKNQTQFEDIDDEDVSYFPPFWKFSQNKINYFRRYTKNDLYHDCQYRHDSEDDPKKPMILEECNGTTCSIFRTIDRLRLIKKEINSVFNEEKLQKMSFIKRIVVIRNNEEYEKMFEAKGFVKNFLSFFETRGVKQNHQFLRNFFGEKIGFYFLFTSHYIQWLVYPSLFGIVVFFLSSVLSIFVDFSTKNEVMETSNLTATSLSNLRGAASIQTTTHSFLQRHIEMIRPLLSCLYMMLLILWGCLYTNSWRCTQKFYRRIWGMTSSSYLSRECDNSIKNYFLFQGIKIPMINLLHKYLKKMLSMSISVVMVAVTIFINMLLIYITEYKVFGLHWTGESLLIKIKESFQEGGDALLDRKVKSAFWYYLSPIFAVIIRTLLSKVNYSVVNWACQFEENVFIDQFENSFISKITLFEFVNYYFYLFFVAYAKKYLGSCANNDCFQELSHQLVMVLLTSTVINILEIGIPFVNQLILIRAQEKKRTVDADADDEYNPRITSKVRPEYNDPIAFEYLEILFNYGYVILFGIASPICFIIALAHIFCERLVDSYKMVKLYSSVNIEGSHGIGIVLKLMKIFTFLAIVTNTTIIYFTLQATKVTASKWTYIFLIENLMVFIYLCVKIDTYPSWFGYYDQIKSNMIGKLSEGNVLKKSTKAYKAAELLLKKIIRL